MKIQQAVVADGSYTLDHYVDFSEIKYDEKYGKKNFFSQWINIVITRFIKEYTPWARLVKEVESYYGTPMSYISGQYYSPKNIEEGEVASTSLLIDRENPMTYYLSFDTTPTQNYKEIIQKVVSEHPSITYLNESMDKKTRLYDTNDLSYYRRKSSTGRITRLPAVRIQLRNPEEGMDEAIEKSKVLWGALVLAHSLNLLEKEPFNQVKNSTEEMTEFVRKLHERGFALRQNEKNCDMLDIYPYKYFSPGTATERDCIGFIKKHYSSWQIYLDFFEDRIDEDFVRYLRLDKSPYINDKVRWIFSNIENEEQFNTVTGYILRQAEIYQPEVLAIWPKAMQKQMLINHGQNDSGFFLLLKNLMEGKNSYSEILDDFNAYGLGKELDHTLQQNELFESKAGYQPPLVVDGESENRVVNYQPFLEETLREMAEEKPKFDYMEEGPALFRIYSTRIAQGYEPLSKKKPHAGGNLFFSRRIKSELVDSCWQGIGPAKDKIIKYYAVFNNCDTSIEETITEEYRKMDIAQADDLEYDHAGNKKQHFRVALTYRFDDFDNELENMRQICNAFFTQTENVCALLETE